MIFLLAAPGIYYLYRFKPDLMFKIQYFFKLDIDKAEPSDWYYMSSTFFSYVTLALGPAIAAILIIMSLLDYY